MEMRYSFASRIASPGIVFAGLLLLSMPAAAQNSNDRVPKGYGPNADQPYAGADPDGTGLPWKEPPADVVDDAKKVPTPRAADGHPDLSGFWGPAGWGYAITTGKLSADGKTYDVQRPAEPPVQTPQTAAAIANRLSKQNLPPYKPELLAKVKDLAEHQAKYDPAFSCAPKGFPRVGPPTEIVQISNEIVFLYDTVNSSEQNAFRIISTDGRQHDPTLNPSYY